MTVILLVVSFVLGFAVGFLNLGELKIDPKVNIIGLLNILITLVVGYVLKGYLDVKRSEKDFIIQQMGEAMVLIDRAHEIYMACYDSERGSPEFLNAVRRFSNAVVLIRFCLEHKKISIEGMDKFDLGLLANDYRQATTSGMFPSGPPSQEEIFTAEDAYRATKEKLSKAIFYLHH